MIKGWRNDPRWVEFYAKRNRERMQREIDRLKAETAIAMDNARADAQMERIHAKPLRATYKPYDGMWGG
jgi:hypothetical protein